MSIYISLERCPSYPEFRINFDKITDSLTKTKEVVIKLKQVDGFDILKVRPYTLKRRAVFLLKGTNKIQKAVEKFITSNAHWLTFREKENLLTLTLPQYLKRSASYVRLKMASNPGEEFFPRSFYVKTQDFEGHFTATHLPSSLRGDPKDLRNVTNAKTLSIFLIYYSGKSLSLTLTLKELIEMHKLADYLYEAKDPATVSFWTLTIETLHKCRSLGFEELLQDLFNAILSSLEKPSAELIELLQQELYSASKDKQERFFRDLTGNNPVLPFFQGYCYKEGIGIPACEEAAVNYYAESANKGYAPAEYALGECYENGWGVTKNLETAWEFYIKAAYIAVTAYKPALWAIARLYESGTVISQNEREATQIRYTLRCQKYAPALSPKDAAAQNHAPSLYKIAGIYALHRELECIKYLERALKDKWIPPQEEYEKLARTLNTRSIMRTMLRELLEKGVKANYPCAQYLKALNWLNPFGEREGEKLLIQAAKQHYYDAVEKLIELEILQEAEPIHLSKGEDFVEFRKKYNKLVDELKSPHIIRLEGNDFSSVLILPLAFQGDLLPSPENEIEEKQRLRQTITRYISTHEKFAAFLPDEEKIKLGELFLFSEGVPQVIQDIFIQIPTFSFYLSQKREDVEWKNILQEIRANPHHMIKIEIDSEGLDQEIIYIHKPLLSASFRSGENAKGPINLGKTKKKILGFFLDYLYAKQTTAELTRSELIELKNLAEHFNAKDLIEKIDKVLNTLSQDSPNETGSVSLERMRKTLSKIRKSPQELIYLRTQDKVFTAHLALLPAYFHAAADFKKKSEQALILDLRAEVEQDTLETFLLSEYGLLEVFPRNWKKASQLFNFCYFTGRTLH